ncbi:DUF1707 and DUF2154 domain-containing protein [Streptomyces sp. ISL-66]|uniref:DUF1707 SHOCT-like domain-containing protein n=1 Tax=Streptomyces sp. ISL-66 TaxID=2819186 RepID=UPI001BE5229C|nr:DUF1707 domain-containing protein [Streptomyces sp. ISL-66]MBT2469672.1 DUF1707 and DUF2154 domain-containing protein [Streptomyces sp. ISL-66]
MSDERPEKPLPQEPVPSEKPLPDLRASDADRERVVERLRDAVAEGRLDMDEFEERLEATYKSRTYAELEPLTRDLPALGATAPVAAAQVGPVGLTKGVPAGSGSAWPARIGGGGAVGGPAVAVAVMSGFQRKGNWTVPSRFHAVAFWGGGEIDLREADFEQREVVINCVAVMGGIEITVPPGVEVDVRGIGVMGAFDQRDSPGPVEPGAPRVVVTGFAFWGGVEVKVKQPKSANPDRNRNRISKSKPRKEL